MFNYKSIQEIYGNDVLKQVKNYEKLSRIVKEVGPGFESS